VQVTEDNGTCIDTTERFLVQIDECTRISELSDSEINIYPNPATSSLVIKCLSQDTDDGFDLLIYNMQGYLVDKVIVASGKDHTEIDVSEYPAGIYTLHMIIGNKQYRKSRFVVTH
jgi:hypothetical protein